MSAIPGYIRIVSKRKGGIGPVAGELVIDVDRTHPVLGNRHVLKNHNDPVERDRVIAAYEVDFNRDMAERGPMYQACLELAKLLLAGKRIALRCWCAPRRCHAEIIRAQVYRLAGLPLPPQEELVSNQGALF